MLFRRFLLPCLLLVLFGCDQQGTLNFSTGEVQFSVSASELALPDELKDDSTPAMIREVPCGAGGLCPSSAKAAVSCVMDLCNPDAVVITVPVGDVIDVDRLTAELPKAFPEADSYMVREMNYAAAQNTLSVSLGEVRILWAPEGASSGMTLLGTLPGLAARTNESGSAVIDPAGEMALSDFLTGTSPRVRFFAQTDVDLEPGQAFPEGELTITAEVALTASGPILN